MCNIAGIDVAQGLYPTTLDDSLVERKITRFAKKPSKARCERKVLLTSFGHTAIYECWPKDL
jgi:hypothetical protein